MSDQFRIAAVSERRRSRQIAGLEAVSRLLVTAGATPELLERVADVMVERFGYALAAIFIVEDNRSSSGRSAATPSTCRSSTRGPVWSAGRHGGKVQLVQDVRADPDYVPATAAS